MTRLYEVIGVYPAKRPLPIGTPVELTEEAARYAVLEGALKPVQTPLEAPDPEVVAVPAVARRRRRRR